MYRCGSDSNFGSSFRGWMQSTGQTSTHAVSFVPIQGSAITYAIETLLRRVSGAESTQIPSQIQIEKNGLYHHTGHRTSRFPNLKSIARLDSGMFTMQTPDHPGGAQF